MARQPTKKAAASKPAATSPKEDQVTTTTPEAPVETQAPANPGNEAPAAEATPEKVVDISTFKAALDAGLAEMDASTGTLAPAQLEPIVKAYQDLPDAKNKAAARADIEKGIKDSLDSAAIPTARALNTVRGEITKSRGASSPKEPKAPVDPTEAFVETVVSLRLAYTYVTQNVPEGVQADWEAKANELASASVGDLDKLAKWSGEGEKPEVANVAVRALKLAQGKAAKGKSSGGGTRTPFDGPKRSIEKHIQEAFAGKPVGTFLTVAQIVSHLSSEYGDAHPSPGAVSARLFPKSGKFTVSGVEPVDSTNGQPKGAKSVAAA